MQRFTIYTVIFTVVLLRYSLFYAKFIKKAVIITVKTAKRPVLLSFKQCANTVKTAISTSIMSINTRAKVYNIT